jgi:surface protein
MFTGCGLLTTVPFFNTSAVTTMTSMFNSCIALNTVPLFVTSAVTTMQSMFASCSSLTTVPLFDTSAVTDMASMFTGCRNLTAVPALVTTAVTSSSRFSNMFQNCPNLASIKAEEFQFTFSVANCKLSGAALDEIYTNLPTVTSQTITVSGNYGVNADTPGIATGKGWTVTG